MNEPATQTENSLIKQGFGTSELVQKTNETSSAMLAAQVTADVEARYKMALLRPRNWDAVRQTIVKECRRPSFANNKSALYFKPIGDGIEGLGIRFVEMALRSMTNVLIETKTIYDDDKKEIVRVMITDLENNITYPSDINVLKTVERRKPASDGTYISVRNNSYGKPTYTLPATDDEILNKRNALISKAMRSAGLRVIPGDLQDEAEQIIRQVRLDKAAQDPDAERRKIVDAFSTLGVQANDLVEYLGHKLDQCTPAQIVNLRGLYGALSNGEITWSEVMAKQTDDKEEDKAAEKQPARKSKAAAKQAPAKENKEKAPAVASLDADDMLIIREKLSALDVPEAKLCEAFEIAFLDQLPLDKMAEAMDWITGA